MCRLTLKLEGKVARYVETKALNGLLNPDSPTPNRRRNLIRLAIKDGLICHHCQKKLVFQWMAKKGTCVTLFATFDHIIPKSLGGTYHISNGVLSCQPCNRERSNLPIPLYHKLKREGTFEGKQLKAAHKSVEKFNSKRKRKTRRKLFKEIFVANHGDVAYAA